VRCLYGARFCDFCVGQCGQCEGLCHHGRLGG